ncbi:MAG: hypothetical protein RSE93_02350 [Oscillospiraceae bacterium]
MEKYIFILSFIISMAVLSFIYYKLDIIEFIQKKIKDKISPVGCVFIIILIGIIVNIIVQTTSAGLNLSPMAYKISFGASMGIVLSLTMFIPSKKK